jgi:hypothetical protein
MYNNPYMPPTMHPAETLQQEQARAAAWEAYQQRNDAGYKTGLLIRDAFSGVYKVVVALFMFAAVAAAMLAPYALEYVLDNTLPPVVEEVQP